MHVSTYTVAKRVKVSSLTIFYAFEAYPRLEITSKKQVVPVNVKLCRVPLYVLQTGSDGPSYKALFFCMFAQPIAPAFSCL
ncbi:MAG: hypothetical protein NVSMB54_25330 [Ktedonobacteraceae bacterium]